jgi:hypothetical protein
MHTPARLATDLSDVKRALLVASMRAAHTTFPTCTCPRPGPRNCWFPPARPIAPGRAPRHADGCAAKRRREAPSARKRGAPGAGKRGSRRRLMAPPPLSLPVCCLLSVIMLLECERQCKVVAQRSWRHAHCVVARHAAVGHGPTYREQARSQLLLQYSSYSYKLSTIVPSNSSSGVCCCAAVARAPSPPFLPAETWQSLPPGKARGSLNPRLSPRLRPRLGPRLSLKVGPRLGWERTLAPPQPRRRCVPWRRPDKAPN